MRERWKIFPKVGLILKKGRRNLYFFFFFKSVFPWDNMLVSDTNLTLLDASAELISQIKLITANMQLKQKLIIKAALGTGVWDQLGKDPIFNSNRVRLSMSDFFPCPCVPNEPLTVITTHLDHQPQIYSCFIAAAANALLLLFKNIYILITIDVVCLECV